MASAFESVYYPESAEDLALAVKHGSVWLDEQDPTWAHKIEVEELVMASSHECVLGQLGAAIEAALFGLDEPDYTFSFENFISFADGCKLPADWSHLGMTPQEAADRGFVLGVNSFKGYATLNALWRAEIEKRVAADD
jgi:hypothetical protein